MTYGIKTVAGVVGVQKDPKSRVAGFWGTEKPLFGQDWSPLLNNVYLYCSGAHCGHALEFFVALVCYTLFFADGSWETECKQVAFPWVARVFAFNIACELVFVGFWHWLVYVGQCARGLKPFKFNPENPYIKKEDETVGFFTSSTGNLEREVFYTTLGWLQSAALQCTFMWLWASGRLEFYSNFFEYPVYSLLYLHFITYWREIHFYWCHRGIHPWFDRKRGLLDGDIGAFLYRHVHSLHHKSYNPGPWSGLSMHPVEHFLYYSCAWVPLIFTAHPLHFLYCKFHADIAPIGGHDGYDEPSANGDFHWLHHAFYECNYGVPFPIDFDKMFGTWVDYKEYKKQGSIRGLLRGADDKDK
eukprot:m.50738 g.50738  ORF g.50738 m.50738 type:complete len:357 (+) comp7261_c0_seq1:112-1182(+)